jgi:menaquinone-dependent protoporphyrinogen oxidase
VRMGQWHESARVWVTAHAAQLEAMPVAFYTVNLTMAHEPEKAGEVRAYVDPLIESTGVIPVDVGLFAGWNEPGEFSFLERTILKAMKAPRGDFRDWAAIDDWAADISTKMGV